MITDIQNKYSGGAYFSENYKIQKNVTFSLSFVKNKNKKQSIQKKSTQISATKAAVNWLSVVIRKKNEGKNHREQHYATTQIYDSCISDLFHLKIIIKCDKVQKAIKRSRVMRDFHVKEE